MQRRGDVQEQAGFLGHVVSGDGDMLTNNDNLLKSITHTSTFLVKSSRICSAVATHKRCPSKSVRAASKLVTTLMRVVDLART